MLLRNVLQVHRHVSRTPNVIQKRNFFQTDMMIKFGQSFPVRTSMDCLMQLHEAIHLPWWSEIILVTLGFRAVITTPLMIWQRKCFLRYETLGPEIEELSKRLKEKHGKEGWMYGMTEKDMQKAYAKELRKEMARLIKRDNCNPLRAGILPMVQIPFWITLSQSYRNLPNSYSNPSAHLAQQQLSQEGTLWFSNLTVPDPTGLLPIITGVMNLINIQLYANERRRKGVQETTMTKVFTHGGRLISLALIPIGLTLPSSMTLYWAVSACWGVAQNVALQNEQVRKMLGITESLHVQKLKKEKELQGKIKET